MMAHCLNIEMFAIDLYIATRGHLISLETPKKRVRCV